MAACRVLSSSVSTLTVAAFVVLASLIPHVEARALAATDTVAEFLNPHNAVRARHNVPPLQWSAALTQVARGYANQRRGDCALVHSTNDYGENLFWGEGRLWKPADAVAAWAAEEASYNYRTNTCKAGADCTHYTQMVWKRTKQVGCAKIICKNGDSFIICNYFPHGNVIGQKPY
ncbi:hypothetical protein Taro_024765 [Colocasia esculenta]|uniref:SCP domain-containing protein n=1 Tax=Colocasia esculenta TaxID=4460 RepID=A0A843V7N2_COLES|nr:hypothetical protein [Colocasia esculenta]